MRRRPHPCPPGSRTIVGSRPVSSANSTCACCWKQYCGAEAAERLGSRWRGGSYELLEHRRTRRPALRWAVGFSDDGAARDFLLCYRKVLEAKSNQLEWKALERELIEGVNSDGEFRIEVRGASVGALEALQPRQETARPAL